MYIFKFNSKEVVQSQFLNLLCHGRVSRAEALRELKSMKGRAYRDSKRGETAGAGRAITIYCGGAGGLFEVDYERNAK